MIDRKKLWELPAEHQLEIIDLALASNHNGIARKLDEAINTLGYGDCIRRENTFSRSVQRKLDLLFASSIELFAQANNRCALRILWCDGDCARQPERYIWALATHPCASDELIRHACSCTRCLAHVNCTKRH